MMSFQRGQVVALFIFKEIFHFIKVVKYLCIACNIPCLLVILKVNNIPSYNICA